MDLFDSNLNRARKSRRTLQNEVRINVAPLQLTRYVNTFVVFKICILDCRPTCIKIELTYN